MANFEINKYPGGLYRGPGGDYHDANGKAIPAFVLDEVFGKVADTEPDKAPEPEAQIAPGPETADTPKDAEPEAQPVITKISKL